ERFPEDEEIIEHLVHNETRRIHWMMHRPRNGWYIRIRSPAFPPGAFILPLPNSLHPPGALLRYEPAHKHQCHLIPTASAPSRSCTRPRPRACMRGSSRHRRRNKQVVINEHRRRYPLASGRRVRRASWAPTPSSSPLQPPLAPLRRKPRCHLCECAGRQRSARGLDFAAVSSSSGTSRSMPPSTTSAMLSPTSAASSSCA
ncbi:hypothetical protein K438DRAFT_1846708, partial [Mycena galopus ATCC 62051]